ncbi:MULTISPECIES: rhodanese-like domain-containing protein [unclassified Peribacillus]|uniref:rhodanese-like domain-containing protein n=1 Tax=unclassified Peribacillus TaxID=2675266 RepID=UPI001914993F|nr:MULTISPECIES: rhodanese-like domain-containing protein [unclassified Peribacillus]MBK5446375.1 rhodanese-like domain-containing protein [Peribacillus sp. TH24]MBK5458959.1 rhodanese-like domain-containing protein [Peribacillus sp. TH27]MBK5480769.1 rhodanese-like domain-containing protein [Peribacillus sp. TH16]MBK5502320.1 rhodanese-like domain-containing protein [Peribacillus sp. TH14]
MKEISPNEVNALLKGNSTINIIDVREVDEVKAGKIPNATHIPLGLVEFRMQDLDKSKEYIMVCRSGGRSSMAAKLLEDHGYKVLNMTGGMLEWNGPIE